MHILVTAIGSMSAEAVISSLKACSFVEKVVGSDIYPKSWLPTSRLVDKFYQVPNYSEDNYINQIKDLCIKENVNAIIPLTDPEVDKLSANRNFFVDCGTRLFISNPDTIKSCRDKLEIVSVLKGHKWIATIPTYQLKEILSYKINFPVIGKPKMGRSSEGLMNFTRKEEIEFLKNRLQDYVFQPIINGDIYTVDIVRDSYNNCFSIPRKELLRTKNGAGLTVEIQKGQELTVVANKLAEFLNIEGCVNFEFILFEKVYYLMDLNPRFSAGIAFSQMSGYDMVRSHLNAFIDERIEPPVEIKQKIIAKSYRDFYMNLGKEA